MPVKTIVVDTARPPEPSSVALNGAIDGMTRRRRMLTSRWGSGPSRALRRPIMYWYASESGSGRKYGGRPSSSSEAGISSWMFSRSRSSSI